MRKILPIISWITFILATMITLGFVNNAHNALECKKVIIHINQNEENYFVEESDIEAMLPFDLSENTSIPISSIDANNIERILNNHPAILNAEVYMTLEGNLTVFIEQRKPIVRVFTNTNESYYLDENGFLMPLSSKFTSHVMIASGFIEAPYSQWYQHSMKNVFSNDTLKNKTMLDDLFQLADFINNNDFWKAQIEHLYVNKDLELELIPRVGSHTIVLGEIVDIQKKFEKLMIFYQKGLSKTGWNEYEVVNLKFENQIVCTKKYN